MSIMKVDLEVDKNYIRCQMCKRVKIWYEYPVLKGNANKVVRLCFKCLDIYTILSIKKLIRMAENRNMTDLRERLFDAMDGLKAKSITVSEAKAICEVAQVIINTAKVEIEYMKAIGTKNGGTFIQLIPNES